MTMQQVATFMLAQTILAGTGNPNGSVAGNTFQLYWDVVGKNLYICATTGTALTAVWVDTSESSGNVNPGLINQVGYYASAGAIISGTSTLPTLVQANITEVGTITTGVWNGTV